MAEKPLLSDLCRICNNKPPKYCCPRCRSLTCSLPCYKRHQTWSQCSGVRDPAAYMKRSQLATPAGIDHDYNFLTGIERAFNDADRDAGNRGIALEYGAGKLTNAKRRLQKSIEDTNVIIRRAPKGMSRQRENHTHCLNIDGADFVSWTVEWILPDGSRKIKNCSDFSSIEAAYMYSVREPQPSKSKKRKRRQKTDRPVNESPSTADVNLDEEAAFDGESDRSKAPEPLARDQQSETLDDVSPRTPILQSDEQRLEEKLDEVDMVNELSLHAATNLETHPETNQHKSEPEGAIPYFYLLKPLTTSSARVLIPVSPSSTLRNILSNRNVLEFPTIFALYSAPDALPEGMQLEKDYGRMIKELDEELKPFIATGHEDVEGHAAFETQEEPTFDESKVLETLKRDVAGVGRE